MGAGLHLVRHVEKLLTKKYGSPVIGRDRLPEGLRLEISPSTYYGILADPDLWDFESSSIDVPGKFTVPVKIEYTLPKYGWRLVIVTEEVLDGGELVPGE